MSLLDDLRQLNVEYWADENGDGAVDAAGHYIELHHKIEATLAAAEALANDVSALEAFMPEGYAGVPWANVKHSRDALKKALDA